MNVVSFIETQLEQVDVEESLAEARVLRKLLIKAQVEEQLDELRPGWLREDGTVLLPESVREHLAPQLLTFARQPDGTFIMIPEAVLQGWIERDKPTARQPASGLTFDDLVLQFPGFPPELWAQLRAMALKPDTFDEAP